MLVRHSFSLPVALVFCIKITESRIAEDDLLVRKLSKGFIRGRHVLTERNTSGYVFLGIPYAEPPVGQLRFRLPKAIAPWPGVMNTMQYPKSCMWNSSITQQDSASTGMGEDCLNMNVFTNEYCLRHSNCAVMYFIHAGMFTFDSPMLYPVDFLVDNFAPEARNIVLVTVVYRLGALGFLNLSPFLTGTSAPKNVAMHDIIMGLEWVQKEIHEFGGDPNRVTINGHSSGATSCDLLAISPKTTGLFQQVIVMSAAKSSWQILLNQNVNASRKLAIAVNCADRRTKFDQLEQVEKTIECLRRVDAWHLIAMQRLNEATSPQMDYFLGPAFDPPNGLWPIPMSTLQRHHRRYPYLIGTLSKELRQSAKMLESSGSVDTKRLLRNCENYALDLYTNWRPATIDCLQEYSDVDRLKELTDDLGFFIPTLESAKYNAESGAPTFLYEWSYDHVDNAFAVPAREQPKHCQEQVYLMGARMGNLTAADQRIREIFTQTIVNFVNTGDPSMPGQLPFVPLDLAKDNYYEINFDKDFKMPGNQLDYHGRTLRFWNETALRHGKSRKITYTKRHADAAMFSDDWAPLPPLLIGDDDDGDATILLERFDETMDFYPEIASNANWNLLFWISTSICILLAVVLLVTCYMLLYNWNRRKFYEQLA